MGTPELFFEQAVKLSRGFKVMVSLVTFQLQELLDYQTDGRKVYPPEDY